MLYDLVLGGLFPSRRHAIDALRSHGALSPLTAKSIDDLQVAPDEAWNHLITQGRVREGPAGHFYLFERPRASARERAVKLIVFYALIVLIPILMFILTGLGH